MSNPLYNRVIITYSKNTPDNQIVPFTNASDVGNYYGINSQQYTFAKEYFTGPYASQATLEFIRDNQSQRPHLAGGNISSLTLSQLQAISGNISITFRNMVYSGTVNMSGVQSIGGVVTKLQTALNKTPYVEAATANDTITPKTINFIGSVQWQSVGVNDGTQLVIGGLIQDAQNRIKTASFDNQLILEHKTGVYALFAGAYFGSTGIEPLTESYGVLHIGHVISGQVKAGYEITGPGVLPDTCIIQDLGGGNWVVNNAQSISGDFNIIAPPLTVDSTSVHGATEDNTYLEIQPGGEDGYNELPSNLSFASGPVADALKLSQSTASFDSTPGGLHQTTDTFLNEALGYSISQGYQFTSLQEMTARTPQTYQAWSDANSIHYIPGYNSTTPAGEYPPVGDHQYLSEGRGY